MIEPFADTRARSILPMPLAISIIHHENLGSIRVAEKNGLRHVGSVEMMGRAFQRYAVSREQYLGQR